MLSCTPSAAIVLLEAITAAARRISVQAKARAAEQREKRKEEAAERRAEEAAAKRVRKEEMRARNLARSRGAHDAISLGDVRPSAQIVVDALSIKSPVSHTSVNNIIHAAHIGDYLRQGCSNVLAPPDLVCRSDGRV